MPHDEGLEQLVDRVLATRKYGSLLPTFVARVGDAERRRARSPGDALRATKSRLHQSVGAFRRGRSWARLHAELARCEEREGLRACARRLMQAHASTRERLPTLERFCDEVLGPLAGAERVLDLACGLFPLGLPWMPFGAGVAYRAYDVDLALVELLNDFFRHAEVDGEALAFDLCQGPPAEEADVVLLLKAFAALEHLQPGAGLRVIEEVRAPVVLVSFPTASLGGRRRGLAAHHLERLRAQLAGKVRQLECSSLPGELVLVVRK